MCPMTHVNEYMNAQAMPRTIADCQGDRRSAMLSCGSVMRSVVWKATACVVVRTVDQSARMQLGCGIVDLPSWAPQGRSQTPLPSTDDLQSASES
jgi:hypothetical protein